jgi:hypothetical protein
MEHDLKQYLNSKPNAKVCIFDNNFVDFCTRLKGKDILVVSQLKQYDTIIIPCWVDVEIKDSPIRIAYIEELRDAGIYVYIIGETEYIDSCTDTFILFS